jgi:hypothetical protein
MQKYEQSRVEVKDDGNVEKSATREDVLSWLRTINKESAEQWTKTLRTYLYHANISQAQLFLGNGTLYAVYEDRVAYCRPFYHESHRGGSSPYKWSISFLESVPPHAPAAALKALAPYMEKQAAMDRVYAETQAKRFALAAEYASVLQPRIEALSRRRQAIGLPPLVCSADVFHSAIPSDVSMSILEYSPENVDFVERSVERAEQEYNDRQIFDQELMLLKPRLEALGILFIDTEPQFRLSLKSASVGFQAVPIFEYIPRSPEGVKQVQEIILQAERSRAAALAVPREALDQEKPWVNTQTIADSLSDVQWYQEKAAPPRVRDDVTRKEEVTAARSTENLPLIEQLDGVRSRQIYERAQLHAAIATFYGSIKMRYPAVDQKWIDSVNVILGTMSRALQKYEKTGVLNTDDAARCEQQSALWQQLFTREKQLANARAIANIEHVMAWEDQWNTLEYSVLQNENVVMAVEEFGYNSSEIVAGVRKAFLALVQQGKGNISLPTIVKTVVDALE